MDNHDKLVRDITDLLSEAQMREFHDFDNTKYPCPKMSLIAKLDVLRLKVVNGEYDN